MNTELALGTESIQTMTSLEIAELTNKRHDNVLTDIRKMLSELELHSPEFSGEYKDSTGRTLKMAVLPKELVQTLITGYSAVLRLRVIRRFNELEAKEIVNQVKAVAYASKEEQAANELRGVWEPLQNMFTGLGFGKGGIKAAFLETAVRIEAKYNVSLVPASMRPRLVSGQRVAKKTAATTALAEIEIGGKTAKVTTLAKSHGVRPAEINLALIRLNFQYKHALEYMPKPDGRKYCSVVKRVTGVNTGLELITGWIEELVEPHLAAEIVLMRKQGLLKAQTIKNPTGLA